MEERPYGAAEEYTDPVLQDAGIDLSGMDLESLRTVQHPVLSALVGDLRARIAAPGSEALWGFDNDKPGPPDIPHAPAAFWPRAGGDTANSAADPR